MTKPRGKSREYMKALASRGAEARWGVGYLAKKRERATRVFHVRAVCEVPKCVRCAFDTHDSWFVCAVCHQKEGNLDKSCKGKP